MTYRLRDDLEHGDDRGATSDAPISPAPDAHLSGGHGAHSVDVGSEGRFTYQRPTGYRSKHRHSSQGGRDASSDSDGPTGYGPYSDYGRDNAPRSWFEPAASPAASPAEPPATPGMPEPLAWTPTRPGETSAWDQQALNAAVGVPAPRRDAESRDPAPADAATESLSAVGPHEPATIPNSRRSIPGLRTEAPGAPDAPPPPEAPQPPAAFDVEVPSAPPGKPKSLRARIANTHVGVKILAAAVVVLVAALGVAVTVVSQDPDTVQVSDDLAADAPTPTSTTQDPETGASPAAPVGEELITKEREQQQALAAARQRAAQRAAAAREAAAERDRQAAEDRASRSAEREGTSGTGSGSGTTGAAVPDAPVDCNTYSGNKATGCALLSEFGFSTSEMSCLDKLWTRESGWRTTASNPSSGAYGIPQALPGSKMADVAGDWQTNAATQIRWGLQYIKGRYSTPCGAWNHSEATGWY